MTPEERITRIENSIQSLIETQARHDTQIAALSEETAKNTAGVRDLIVVSRTMLEQIRESHLAQNESRAADDAFRAAHDAFRAAHDRDIAELRELHKESDARLHALIAEVDRIIRKDQH